MEDVRESYLYPALIAFFNSLYNGIISSILNYNNSQLKQGVILVNLSPCNTNLIALFIHYIIYLYRVYRSL